MAVDPKSVADVAVPTTASASVSAKDSISVDRFNLFLDELSAIAAAPAPIDIAMIVIEHTGDVLEVDRTSFFFVDGEFLDLVIAKGAVNIRMPKSAGFAGLCATTGETVNIPDAYLDDRFNSSFDKKSGFHTKQILCVPVRDPSDNIVGVLQAINKKDDSSFDKVDESLLKSIGQQVGLALRFQEQKDDARHATDQKNALIKFIKSMSTAGTVSSVLFTLNNAASELMDADRCTLYVVDHMSQSMRIASSDASVDITLPIGGGIAGTVAETGKTLLIPDAYVDDRFDQSWDRKTGYRTRSMLVMPVWPILTAEEKSAMGDTGPKPCAVVQLINKTTDEEASFDKEDEELLEVLLKFLSPAVSGSKLFQRKKKVSEMSRLQDLTQKSVRRIASCDVSKEATIIAEEAEGDEEDESW